MTIEEFERVMRNPGVYRVRVNDQVRPGQLRHISKVAYAYVSNADRRDFDTGNRDLSYLCITVRGLDFEKPTDFFAYKVDLLGDICLRRLGASS